MILHNRDCERCENQAVMKAKYDDNSQSGALYAKYCRRCAVWMHYHYEISSIAVTLNGVDLTLEDLEEAFPPECSGKTHVPEYVI